MGRFHPIDRMSANRPPVSRRIISRAGILLLATLWWPARAVSGQAQHNSRVAESVAPDDALPRVADVLIPGTEVSFQLAMIPGGAFRMGSPEVEVGRDDDEGPQRLVLVDSFWMSVHEVTYDEYAVFRYPALDADSSGGETGNYSPDAVARPSPPYEDPAHGMGNHGFPAAGMTQWGALHYAKWLSDKTGEFFRLPTEAEWEYACRAGSDAAYFHGEDVEQLGLYGWYYENSDEVFQPVGTREPNAFGLYDMHGNVAEWTLDQYQVDMLANLPDSIRGPWVRPTSLHPRTVRGGAYDDDADALRCAARLRSNMNWKRRDPQIPKSYWWNTDSPFVGFRLVRPVSPPGPDEQEEFWRLVLGE